MFHISFNDGYCITDNDIHEDEVIELTMLEERRTQGCCTDKCLARCDQRELLNYRTAIKELTKNELDMLLLGNSFITNMVFRIDFIMKLLKQLLRDNLY